MTLRKRVVQRDPAVEQPEWLQLEEGAELTVTSEAPGTPLEAALVEGAGDGWRAGGPGEQRIQIRFDRPRDLSLIHVVFEEREHERVQEFALRWSSDAGRTFKPIVRQQFSFSPWGATREVENYTVDLRGVTDIDLQIVPDISRRPCVASLTALRFAGGEAGRGGDSQQ